MIYKLLSIFLCMFIISCTDIKELQRINTDTNNEIRYKSDKENYGVNDYWADPYKTLKIKSGDCEDIAIVKRLRVRQSIPDAKTEIIIVHLYRKDIYHAVLIVDNTYILDNLRNDVITITEADYFVPTGLTLKPR